MLAHARRPLSLSISLSSPRARPLITGFNKFPRDYYKATAVAVETRDRRVCKTLRGEAVIASSRARRRGILPEDRVVTGETDKWS